MVRKLRFPKPYKGKPVTLDHPMRFSPPQGNRRIGKLSRSEIDRAFMRYRHDFQTCYEKRQKSNKLLKGTINVKLTVLPDGRVTKVLLENPFDSALAECLKPFINRMRFTRPKHSGEVDVVYPLKFAPNK